MAKNSTHWQKDYSSDEKPRKGGSERQNRDSSGCSSLTPIKPRDSKRDYYSRECKKEESHISDSEQRSVPPQFDILMLIDSLSKEFLNKQYLK